MKTLMMALWATLACTQFTAELVTYRHDGQTEQVIIEREESGTLLINTTTGETRFVVKTPKKAEALYPEISEKNLTGF
jgi:hypothetical protein